MNIRTLEQYVDSANRWNAIFKGEQFSLVTAKGRQRVADRLEADLSPENLTCDGELDGFQIRAKAKMLNRCVEELKSIDPSVVFYEYN